MTIDDPDVVGSRYETKTFKWSQPSRSIECPIMITCFNSNGHKVLEEYGWRGNYFMFANVDPGAMEMSNDPMRLTFTTSELRDFLMNIKISRIPFHSIEDGGLYGPEDAVDMLQLGDTDGVHD